MKKIATLLRMLLLFCLIVAGETKAGIKTSATSGLWSATTTWVGGAIPIAGDTAIIANGHTVTVSTGFTLDVKIRVNAGGTLICNASIRLQNSDSVVVAGTLDLTVNTALNAQGSDHPRISIWSGGRMKFGTSGTTDITLWGIGAGSTVEYYGAAQSLNSFITTYSNLILSGSGTKTLAANVTVNGTLSMQGSATLSLGANTLGYGTAGKLEYNTSTPLTAGSEWVTPFAGTGGVSITNTGAVTLNAAKVFNTNVPLTIGSGSTLATNNFQLTFGGNFANSGVLTAGSSPIVITGTADQSISGFTTTGLVSMTKTGGIATLTGNVSALSLTLDGTGGTLNMGSALTHTFTGAFTRTNGTFNCGSSTINIAGSISGTGGSWIAGTSTVNFTSAGGQTIPGVTYYDLGFSGAGAKTIPAGTTVTVGRNWAVNAPLTMTTTANASVAGNVTGSGAIIMGSGTMTIGGNWTNNGTFTPGTGTVVYNGGSAQAVAPLTYNNLTVNKAGGAATLGGSATVNGALNLMQGVIATTASFSLNLGTAAAISGAGSSSYVNGNVRKTFGTGVQAFTFPIGDASNYTPVAVAFPNITTGGSLTAFTTSGQHANISTSGINPARDVNRFWTLTNDAIGSTGYSATFTFIPADLIGSPNTATFVVRNYASSWTPTTIGTRTSTTAQATGLTLYGDFAIGNQLMDHYTVSAPSPQSTGAVFSTTVTGFDILAQTVADDNATVVTMSSTGNAQFDGNGDGTFGDATKMLSSGTFTINTKDDVAETVTISATDGSGKSGTSNSLVITAPSVTVNLKVFLAGPFSGGAMTTTLNSAGRLPLSSATAYNAGTYNYTPKTVTSIPNATIVDWVLVELRTLPAASSKVSTQAAFLKSDGTVVDIDGASALTFNNIASNTYYVVVRHRNHLPVMSAAAIPLNPSSAAYDFTTALAKSYGSNGMTVLSGGAYGMWAGDINRNGSVKFTGSQNDDAALISAVGVNSLSSIVEGYLDADANLDGKAAFAGASNDHAVIIGSVGLTRLTRIIASQVPN